MNRFFAWILLASALIAGQTYRYPIQYSGGAVSHADADGYRHVPRTLGTANGNCLLTHGSSGDAYWGACPGASGGLDSAHVSALISDSLDANSHGWVTIAGHVDSARVAGLSDSAKALIRYARTTAVHDTADTLRKSIATKPVKHRFSISSTTGVPPLTMSYNNTSRVLTLTPTGSSFSWWWYGIEHTQSTPLVLPAHSATTGLYFAWFDSLGTVNITTTPFDLLRCVPIALFERNSTIGQTWVYPETHTDQITPLDHLSQHTTVGTRLVQGGAAITGYTLNSDLLASVTYGIGSATIWDEDNRHSIAALADGGTYQVRHRTAPGVWAWTSSLSTPYRVGTTYITADVAGVQTELNGAGLGQYVNYYVVLIPCLNGPQTVVMQGQAIYSTQAEAEAESWGSLDKTGLPYVEFYPVWQITYRARSSYSGVSGRVQMTRVAAVGAAVAAGTASVTTLQQAYNASPTPQIVTSATAGPVTVQRGSASDTNAVIQVQNGAGSVTARINGDGAYTGSAATLTTGRTIAVSGDVTGTATSFNGSANISIPATVTKVNGTALSGLATGLLKNTTATGVPSIAVAGTDYVSPAGLTTALGAYLPLAGGTMAASAAVMFPGSYGGAVLRDLTSSSPSNGHFAIYGSGITPSGLNYGLAVRYDGTSAFLNGTTSSNLAVGSVPVLQATTGNVTISGTASITGHLSGVSATFGRAGLSSWGPSPTNFAWFGDLGQNNNAFGNSGFLQATANGSVYMCAPSTGAASIQYGGANKLVADANGITINNLSTGGIVKAGAGTGTLALATSSNILAGISPDLWIGAPSGRGANSIGFGNLATGAGLWGWAFAQDADGAALVNAPSGKTISYNIGGVQQGYTDYLGFHMTALGSTDVTSTNNTTSNSMINSQDRRAYSTLTATNAASPGYGPDIMSITGPAHSLAPAASGSTYRQYRMPTASGKSGVVIILSLGVSGPVNAPYLLAYTGESIHEKDNGTVVGDDTSPYVRSGTIALISDGTGWWVF